MAIFMSRMKGFKLLLAIGLLACRITIAQQIPGMHIYDASDGYTAHTGYIIQQDSTGYIWIGSDRGAIRFDGHIFEVINESSGLRDREILQATPAFNRRVIFSPLLNNWACYKDGRLLTNDELDLKQIENTKLNFSIASSNSDEVWLGDSDINGTFFKMDRKGLKRIELRTNTKFGILQAFDDRLLIALEESVLAFLYPEQENFEILKGYEEFPNLEFAKVDSAQQLLVAYSSITEKVYLFDIRNGNLQLRHSYPVNKPVKQISIDRNNRLWVIFHMEGIQYWGPVDELRPSSKPLELFPQSIINCVFVDRDNNLWFSTKEQQRLLFVSARHWISFLKNCQHGISQETPPIAVQKIEGTGVAIAYKGQSTLDLIGDTYVESIWQTPNGEPINDLQGAGDRLIVESAGKIFVLRFSGHAVQTVTKSAERVDVKDAVAVKEKLYISTHSGVLDADLSFISYYGSILYENRSTCVGRKNDHELYIGTPIGLKVMDLKSGEFVNVNDSLLSKSYISALQTLPTGDVVIGTTTDGLFLFDQKQSCFKAVPYEGPEGKTIIRHIAPGLANALWLGTDRGLYRLRFDQNLEFIGSKRFRVEDGLPGDDISDLAVYQGSVYALSTSAGLAILTPPFIKRKEKQEKVRVLKAMHGEETTFSPQKVDLQYNDNDLQLRLSDFSFRNDNLGYDYILEGHSKQWYRTLDPQVIFTGLPPGNYTFIATNDRNDESSFNYLPIKVVPAFWQTTWFLVALVFLGIAIIYLALRSILLRSRMRSLQKIETKKKLAQLELEAIKAQINPHFIYNCLNSIQYFTQSGELNKAGQYLDLFSVLIRQTMNLSRIAFATVEQEVDYLSNYLKMEKMRFKDRLSFKIDIDSGLSTMKLLPPMLLQPFVENALKHGIAKNTDGGHIKIQFAKGDHEDLEVFIEDNGPGFKEEKTVEKLRKGNSLGLRLSKSRLYTYNELFKLGLALDVISKDPNTEGQTGTVIKLTIPHIDHETASTYS